MGFFARMGMGWRLGKRSLRVVWRDKTLMLFPVFSAFASILVMIGFFYGIGPQELQALAEGLGASEGQGDVNPVTVTMVFIGYFTLYYVIVYFNVALIAASRMSIEGHDTSPADGFREANKHLDKVLLWALVSGTVGLLLSMIENEERLGRIVRMVLGFAWTAVSYFVVPVMIFEGKNPFGAIGRSWDMMKSTWGENLSAQVGLGILSFLGFVVGIALAVLIPHPVSILIGVLIVASSILLATTAKSVLQVALYEYAHDGKIPGDFDGDELRAAFGTR